MERPLTAVWFEGWHAGKALQISFQAHKTGLTVTLWGGTVHLPLQYSVVFEGILEDSFLDSRKHQTDVGGISCLRQTGFPELRMMRG